MPADAAPDAGAVEQMNSVMMRASTPPASRPPVVASTVTVPDSASDGVRCGGCRGCCSWRPRARRRGCRADRPPASWRSCPTPSVGLVGQVVEVRHDLADGEPDERGDEQDPDEEGQRRGPAWAEPHLSQTTADGLEERGSRTSAMIVGTMHEGEVARGPHQGADRERDHDQSPRPLRRDHQRARTRPGVDRTLPDGSRGTGSPLTDPSWSVGGRLPGDGRSVSCARTLPRPSRRQPSRGVSRQCRTAGRSNSPDADPQAAPSPPTAWTSWSRTSCWSRRSRSTACAGSTERATRPAGRTRHRLRARRPRLAAPRAVRRAGLPLRQPAAVVPALARHRRVWCARWAITTRWPTPSRPGASTRGAGRVHQGARRARAIRHDPATRASKEVSRDA